MIRRSLAISAGFAVALGAPAAGIADDPEGATEDRVEALAEDVAELRSEVVRIDPVASSVERVSEALAALEEEVATLRRARRDMPEVAEALGDLEERLRALEAELGRVRAQVADLEQPVVAPPPDADVERDDGFSWVTGDEDYALTLWALAQPRYQLEVGDDAGDIERQALRMRRARVGLYGHIGGPSLRYVVQADLAEPAPLFDALLDYHVRDELILRAGQYKIPHTRAFLTSGRDLGFAERPAIADAFRYDRDTSAAVRGALWAGRLTYHGGVTDTAGRDAVSADMDLGAFLRLDAAIAGEGPEYAIADVAADRELRASIGGSLVQEAARAPDEVGGVPLGVTDVDADGDRDAIRVTSASADASVAAAGLDVTIEGLWRREDWGAILDHPDNAAVREWVGEGGQHYFGGYGQVTYAAVPDLLVVGGRLGYGDRPLLGLGGRDPAAPRRAGAPPDVGELWELGLAGRLYRGGSPILGADYAYFDHEVGGGGPEHRFILEAQVDI